VPVPRPPLRQRPPRGGQSAALRQRVVDEMAPVVEAIARRYAGGGGGAGCPQGGRIRSSAGSGTGLTLGGWLPNEEASDLISEGYIGLLAAMDQYRLDRGARFSTYATHRIHGQIRHYLRDRGNRRLIRPPSWLQEQGFRLRRQEAQLMADLGRPPTTAELAERMSVSAETIEELQMLAAGPTILSLTEGGDDDEWGGGGHQVDLAKIRNDQSVSWQLPVEDHIFLEALMGRLKELEQKVIRLFYFQGFSQTDIARTLDISCNYVGYLLKSGLAKLRRQIEADELRDTQLRVQYSPRRMAGDPTVIDAATGLYTAGYFHSRLAEEITRACRHRQDLALVVLALDGVGVRINDRTPNPSVSQLPEHPKPKSGKKVRTASVRSPSALKELGVALRECLRKADIPARVDPETLAVALPQTGEGAVAVAKRMSDLLTQVAAATIASGVALYPADGREPTALLAVARARAAGGSGK
jgi:RNA polymerase sigma-B factor